MVFLDGAQKKPSLCNKNNVRESFIGLACCCFAAWMADLQAFAV